jgi:hypothetical protein
MSRWSSSSNGAGRLQSHGITTALCSSRLATRSWFPERGDRTYSFRAHSEYLYLTDRERTGDVLALDAGEGWSEVAAGIVDGVGYPMTATVRQGGSRVPH